jgi:Hemolysins and related proteins containing CBS domains
MSEEPPQSFFSKIINLFSEKREIEDPNVTDQPSDEQIEELIQNVLNIKDSIVKEIMIPKVNISSINEDNTLEEIYEIVKDTKHSRYPVFTSDSERVIGILHVKDLVDIKNNLDFHISDLLREPKYTPRNKSCNFIT